MNPVSNLKTSLLAGAFLLLTSGAASARYAAIVIDADSGRIVHEVESTQRWYPASLTKVMTIYMTFAAIEAGQLHLRDTLSVSAHAARQPTSKLGLRQGQAISVENAIMAVTTRSANDAAVVLAERLGGSESRFAAMMTQQARSMGMYNSSFQNASGLPDEGQISSARDLALLSAALIRDFPQYYRYFSATEFAYNGRVLPNTNKILKTYPDADGLKTGFTCGSGYNLIASARRDGHRLIGVLLGAHSSAERFQQMANLLDLGFEKSQLGAYGMPVDQLRDANFTPPPFQLSSNRCAGSAAQMGADSSSGAADPIRIKPGKSTRLAENRPVKTAEAKNRAAGGQWAVMLGDHGRKIDADVNLKQARYALGPAAKSGQPHIVRVKTKGRMLWRTEWMGLNSNQAKDFCKKIRSKGQSCTLLPG
ncbi:D-alanyl-D-alanine carboxypeptidase [Methylomonas sp. SURF-2]|uniref:D-alanyl-D-alanine carboxypeptidase n=1 Tax=Methylomonas subterranea TaxID=2952225 RepID=A0ABT1TGI0_9GAMM|nr:D-alanyl-D-alanine carboxypeptidase family protein [Methylomonas sp. SURF-2]MCQ8103864.1 D-alanyl-D-alanine carboxypeptidase [Methylomonas sp. SURF-2]